MIGAKQMEVSMKIRPIPDNRIILVKAQDSPEFIRSFNENKISKELLASCRKAGKLFGHNK